MRERENIAQLLIVKFYIITLNLNQFNKLQKESEQNREKVAEVFEKANDIMPKLSDADRISLQSQMDEVRMDKCQMNGQIVRQISRKIDKQKER